ncbi:carbohydrate ABC transporter permease [Ruania albidiflava]|uniref:carbohydrate ABC transporter permease n=1 Tax=Ruania albidiflava TaxID=366586 RepID=UPI0003B77091|nr:sugar ABC transporter permease [Ruania albidiflava]
MTTIRSVEPESGLAPETSRRAPRAPKHQGGSATRRWSLRAPLLPALIFTIALTQLPFIGTLIVSFMEWNSLFPNDIGFIGLSNYAQVLADAELRNTIAFTVQLTAIVVVCSMVLGFAVALLVNEKFFGRGVVRSLLVLPFLVVPVAGALFWKHAILNPSYGLINGTLTAVWSAFGSSSPPQPDLLSTAPLVGIALSLIWRWTPFMMLILLAGLQSRRQEVMEAAAVDGAGAWNSFRYMTLPHMRRYLELGGLFGSIYLVQEFDAIFMLTAGGLDTTNLPYAVYKTFYLANDYGLASALGVVVVIGTIIIAMFTLRVLLSLFKENAR